MNATRISLFLCVVVCAGISFAQTTLPVTGPADQAPADPTTIPTTPSATPPEAQPAAPAASETKNIHLELGGFASSLSNNYGTWDGGNVSVMYGGLKHFSPFGSVSTQSHDGETQPVYGGGSYINVNQWFYAIVGVSGTSDRGVNNIALYPHLRWDASGLFKVPKVKGLVASVGVTEFYSDHGAGGRMVSVGGIYYVKKAVISGAILFNSAWPGNIPSKSGQFGVMYGTRGKWYVGGGVSGGLMAYQLVSAVPFDVRFNSVGTFFFFQRWVGRNWGIISRYDFQSLMGAYQRNGLSASLFFDF